MRLSQHFTLAEMIASQEAARRGIDNTPTPEVLEALKETCAQMEKVRALLGKPILVSSGYRCPALNEAIGGWKYSAHMTGRAVDFICPRVGSPYDVCKAIEASDIEYDQLIHEFGAWTHISFARALRRNSLTIFADGKGYRGGIIEGVA